MNEFHWIFCLGTIFFGFILFLIPAFRKNKTKIGHCIDATLKISGSFLISIGLLEIVLISLQNLETKKLPHQPQIFVTYKAHSHILIKNSILFVAPPYGEFRNFGYQYNTNGLGFRERGFPLKKDKNIFRILVFGGSITFGTAVDNDHRYSNVLEEMLKIKTKGNIEVLNFGMGAYNLEQKHDLMKAILKNVETDLVIIGFYGSNLEITTKKRLLRFAKTSVPSSLFKEFPINQEYFFNPSRNFATIPTETPKIFISHPQWYEKILIYKYLEARTNININKKLPSRDQWKYFLNEFNGMLTLTKQHNLPPPILLLLNNGNVNSNKNYFRNPIGDFAQFIRLNSFIKKELKEVGFHVVDTLPLYKKYNGMSLAASEWDEHPNYLGHYIYAKSIFDYLIANDLLRFFEKYKAQ